MCMAESEGFNDWKADPEMALGFLGTYIGRAFNVSAEVISKRLRIEELWLLRNGRGIAKWPEEERL